MPFEILAVEIAHFASLLLIGYFTPRYRMYGEPAIPNTQKILANVGIALAFLSGVFAFFVFLSTKNVHMIPTTVLAVYVILTAVFYSRKSWIGYHILRGNIVYYIGAINLLAFIVTVVEIF